MISGAYAWIGRSPLPRLRDGRAAVIHRRAHQLQAGTLYRLALPFKLFGGGDGVWKQQIPGFIQPTRSPLSAS
jgi:hypothetical protein